jgi:hypothetical protein
MTVEAFARSLDRARKRADTHQAALHAIYQDDLRRAANKAARNLVSQAALTASDWQPPPEGTLVTGVGVSVALKEQQARAAETVIRLPLENAGIAWDASDPLLQTFLQQTEAWAGLSIEQAFQPELRKIITEAFQQGLSVKDAATLIRTTFSETSVWQAEMLARSNLNMLGNGGMQVAVTRYNERAAAAGDKLVQTKTWVTAGDSAVRPSHVAAAGQTVPFDQSFQVGGSQLSFPGDPGGALAEVLNCRCIALYGTSARRNLTAAVLSPAMATVRQKGKRRGKARHVPIASGNDRRRWRPVNPMRDMAAAAMPTVQWVSDLAFEGTATGDGRFMLPGSLKWRDLPLTLMAQTVTDEGHDGAFIAGRIDKINRTNIDIDGASLEEGVTSLRGGGIFDMGGENGAEIARLVGDETLRGVSVDLAVLNWAFRDPDTGEIIEPLEMTEEQMDKAFLGQMQFAVREGELLAATVCPTPAFADAKIALAASGQHVLRIVTSFEIVDEALIAAAAPVAPPREWFYVPEPDRAVPLSVTDDGRIHGHIAAWGSCYLGRPGECFQPPRSPSSYAYFNLGEIVCKDGTTVACGQITMDTDHAPLTRGTSWQAAKAHYEQTGLCVADVRAIDGQHGIFVSGALRPNLSDQQVRELRAAKPSGDWRQITPGGPLELIGALEVNRPGYPVPRPQLALAASAAHPEGEPVALIAAGVVDDAAYERHLEVLGARLDGRDALAALIG